MIGDPQDPRDPQDRDAATASVDPGMRGPASERGDRSTALAEGEVQGETRTSTLDGAPEAPPDPEPQAEGEPSPKLDATSAALAAHAEVESGGPGRHRTHGRLKTWVIVAGVLAGLAILAFASTFTPLFAAKTVHVEGADHLTARQVRRIAKVEPGVNVVRLDSGRAERRLERHAWVADAEIAKALPSGVTIIVRERTPAAVVLDDAGSRELLAGDGTELGSPSGGPEGLPVVAVPAGQSALSDTQRMLAAAVADSLPPAIARAGVTIVAGEEEVDLFLRGGVTVSYGGGTELEAKGQALLAVVRWAERQGVRLSAIGVVTPGAPIAVRLGGVTVTPGGAPSAVRGGATPTPAP